MTEMQDGGGRPEAARAYDEYPVFVPAGEDRLAAVVCAPAGDLTDLGVVLLTGGNYTRTHRNRMWVRAARELAARGVPSIRFDYHGVGDSTGRVVLELERPLEADAHGAADLLKAATGVSRLALVSTCFGGRTAMAAAAQREDVVSTTLFPLPILTAADAPTKAPMRRRVRQRIKRSELGAKLLRSARVKRARTTVAKRREAPALVVSPRFRRDTGQTAKRGEVRFVTGETTKELPETRRLVDELRRHLTAEELARIEIEVVPGTDIHRFQTFAEQDVVISHTVAAAMRALERARTGAATRVTGP
jgi:alpha/beta superfamily hydrolase